MFSDLGEFQPQNSPLRGSIQRSAEHRFKRKRPGDREKVTRACDVCKKRKSRCSGTAPCNRCQSLSIDCKYEAPHRRGQPLSPPPANGAVGNHSSPTSYGARQNELVENPRYSSGLLNFPARSHVQPEGSSRNSPEREATVFEGHYIGPTSGITFLHRSQDRLKQNFASFNSKQTDHSNLAPSSIFEFGDKPSTNYSNTRLILPKRAEARELVTRYFDFAIPTYRFLHQQTVEEWLERLYEEEEEAIVAQGRPLTDGKVATVLVVLATATLYTEDKHGVIRDAEQTAYEQSGMFFAAAERRLIKELGPARLESVQARLAMCLYLMGSSRINQGWYLFGTTAQLILSLGLHCSKNSRSKTHLDVIEIECRRRAFWSAYTLDKYLSVILGRPGIFRDEDIDQALPSRISDADIGSSQSGGSIWKQCVMDAPVYHAKLARIIRKICNDLYPTNPAFQKERKSCAEKHTLELKAWKESLPAFLDTTKVDPSILVPTFRRQSTVLKLAYAHALILVNRPFLLNNLADLTKQYYVSIEGSEDRIEQCIDAALLVVSTINDFVENGMMYRNFWFSQYISFCAITTLYVYTIQQSQNRKNAFAVTQLTDRAATSNPGYMRYFDAAEKCQRVMSEASGDRSPSKRYGIILDELKREVLEYLQNASVRSSTAAGYEDADMGRWTAQNSDYQASQPQLTALNLTAGQNGTNTTESTMGVPDFQELAMDNGNCSLPETFISWPELDSWAMAWPGSSEDLG